MVAENLDRAVERSHRAVAAVFPGDPGPAKALFSDDDDVTLGNPFGPFACGRKKIEEFLCCRSRTSDYSEYDCPPAGVSLNRINVRGFPGSDIASLR